MDKNKFFIDLTKKDSKFEVASARDSDLMQILCYATHEGENENGTIFPPTILFNTYTTFVDKPVVIVPDNFNNPTTHGYDYKTKKFDNKKRVQVGHVVDAYPVMVKDDEVFRIWDAEELNSDEFEDAELRIVTAIVVYKHYFLDIAERLQLLHSLGNLNFSMEAVVDAYQTEEGKTLCTNIKFTGLAIVDKPAFTRAKSIEVASKKEEEQMDFKELYEAEKAKNETLIAEKAVIEEDLESTKTELAETKEELANSKAEVVTANAEIKSLQVYKEKIEKAEKEKLGEDRGAKLEKFGVKDYDKNELAEKTPEEFADMLISAAEKMEVASVNKDDDYIGVPQHNTGMKSDKEELLSCFNTILK